MFKRFFIILFLNHCHSTIDCNEEFDSSRINKCDFHETYAITIDQNFTNYESNIITNSLNSWSYATDSRINFTLKSLNHDSSLNESVAELASSVVKLASPLDNDYINYIDDLSGTTPKAITMNNKIFLIIDRIPNDVLKIVPAHEFGHILGLEHNMFGVSIMSFSYNSTSQCVKDNPMPTKSDLEILYSLRCAK